MEWQKILGIIALVAAAGFITAPAQVSADTTNTTTSTLVVSGIIDVTINATTIDFGSLSPNTANSSSTTGGYPILVTLHANTNTITNLQVNGSNMLSGGNTLAVNNLTYSNMSSQQAGYWRTELNGTFASGNDAGHHGYNDWLAIPDPTSDTTRTIYWWANVPASQAKGSYSGNVYIKMVDAG